MEQKRPCKENMERPILTESVKIKKYTKNIIYKGNLKVISKLFFSAAPEYLEIFNKYKINKNIFIKTIINQAGSELESFYLLENNNKAIGIVSGYSYEDIFSKKMKSYFTIQKLIKSKKKKISINNITKNFISLPKFRKESFYLSRLSVLKKYRKLGYANLLFNKIEKSNQCKKSKILFLYVISKNIIAINFYLSKKFKLCKKKNKFNLMYKTL